MNVSDSQMNYFYFFLREVKMIAFRFFLEKNCFLKLKLMSPLRGLKVLFPLIFYNHINPLGLENPIIDSHILYQQKTLSLCFESNKNNYVIDNRRKRP